MLRAILVALRALAANKLRSVLAVLGLFIGTFSFIAMIGIGKGAEKRATESIQNLGVNLLFVYPGAQNRGMMRPNLEGDGRRWRRFLAEQDVDGVSAGDACRQLGELRPKEARVVSDDQPRRLGSGMRGDVAADAFHRQPHVGVSELLGDDGPPARSAELDHGQMLHSQAMTDKVVVLVTCSSAEEAARIAQALVERRLAACANIVPGIRSIYRWEGKVQDEQEALLIIKTTRARFAALREAVEKLHSYSVPEVIALPIVDGAEKYLKWMEEST